MRPPIEEYDITFMPTDADFDGDVIARKISSTEAILVASPDYLKRRGAPGTPQDLIKHEILRLKVPGLHPGSGSTIRTRCSGPHWMVPALPRRPSIWWRPTLRAAQASEGGCVC